MRGWVLVTGASRGIGRATVQHLVERGFHVFAGVRTAADGDRWRETGGDSVVPLELDVTADDEVAAAVRAIERATGDAGLVGLVNNAGMVVAGPLEGLTPADLRRQFDVNFFGPWAVTHACLPLLHRAGGRIVNVSSVNGRIVSPFATPYAASKFALEALSDGLRLELARTGIRVSVVQPGAVRTDIWETTARLAQSAVAGMPSAVRKRYAGVVKRIEKGVGTPARAVPAARVARVIARALTARRPRPRYVVGWDARAGIMARWLLPDIVMDRLLAGRQRRRARAAAAETT